MLREDTVYPHPGDDVGARAAIKKKNRAPRTRKEPAVIGAGDVVPVTPYFTGPLSPRAPFLPPNVPAFPPGQPACLSQSSLLSTGTHIPKGMEGPEEASPESSMPPPMFACIPTPTGRKGASPLPKKRVPSAQLQPASGTRQVTRSPRPLPL